MRAAALGADPEFESERELASAPARIESQESEAIRVGVPRTVADDVAEERAAMAAIVAEVAAVERFAGNDLEAHGDEKDQENEDEPEAAAAAPVVPPDAPIIVESASLARMRQSEAAEAAAEGVATPEKTPKRRWDSSASRTAPSSCRPPICSSTSRRRLTTWTSSSSTTWPSGWSRRCRTTACAARSKRSTWDRSSPCTSSRRPPARAPARSPTWRRTWRWRWRRRRSASWRPFPARPWSASRCPNQTREIVYLKEILQDSCCTGAASKLQVALGKDIKGAPVSVNLTKMPHLLVAGTTGSGKSVAVNGMITSILYNASPEEVRFIMVDPKMLELSIYEGIPHLLLPVVTDPKKANLALRWAVDEMERRYELLAKTGVRDVASYNAKIDAAGGQGGGARGARAPAERRKNSASCWPAPTGPSRRSIWMRMPRSPSPKVPMATAPASSSTRRRATRIVSDVAAAAQATQEKAATEPKPTKLPYIVIVIDEFADLMMVAPKDVETSVARLAQKARAAGLHLILATQRPSVDVITGLIKANFPSRIALQVASKIDSRTILDQSGAETLLGNGDMLFSDRGTKLRRIHGAFLSDDEVHRVVDFLKKQAKPVYDMDILKPREEDAEEGGGPADSFHDDLYDQAVAIVCDTRQASVSYIQRRLQIGYNRSARMVEQMERDGIVGPTNGAKPRDVLAPQGEYLAAGG